MTFDPCSVYDMESNHIYYWFSMLGVKWLLLSLYPTLCLAGVTLEETKPEHVPLLLSPSCPLSLILVGPPSEQMKYAEDFLKSLVPSLMEEVALSYYRISDTKRFPRLAGALSFRDLPVQFILKRGQSIRHYRGKLKHTDFVKFIRVNMEDYSEELTDLNFDSFTGLYTWEGEVDWLIQFYGRKQYPKDLWSDVGYRVKGFSRLAHINVSSSPYTKDRFSYIMENMSLPATLFFRNRTVYRYIGKLAASNFAEFLRDFFYNPKAYHKMMFDHGPTPYNIPAAPRLYHTLWDYLVIPEIYNILLLVALVAVISVVRRRLKGLQEVEAKQKRSKEIKED